MLAKLPSPSSCKRKVIEKQFLLASDILDDFIATPKNGWFIKKMCTFIFIKLRDEEVIT